MVKDSDGRWLPKPLDDSLHFDPRDLFAWGTDSDGKPLIVGKYDAWGCLEWYVEGYSLPPTRDLTGDLWSGPSAPPRSIDNTRRRAPIGLVFGIDTDGENAIVGEYGEDDRLLWGGDEEYPLASTRVRVEAISGSSSGGCLGSE